MVRYSFPVGLLHSQLHAGLARRTPTTDRNLENTEMRGKTTGQSNYFPV